MSPWVLEDLKRSGITRVIAKKLSLKEENDGYVFPYFDIDSEPLIIGSGFAKRAYSRKKLQTPIGKQKYVQAKGTGCHIYLPPILDWRAVAESDDPIWITEGEKKAVCACVAGIPCMGLGGVFSWLEKHGVIEELETFPLDDRMVSIVFDADYRTNPKVMDALIRLYRYLENRGCEVYVADLPDETKGLDDFIVAYGKKEAIGMLRGEDLYGNFDIGEVSGANECEKFYRRFVLILDSGKIVDMDRDEFIAMSPQTFLHYTSDMKAFIEVSDKRRKGGIAMKEVALSQKWLNEGKKQVVDRVGYVPVDKVLLNHDGAEIYNRYRPSETVPVAGDMSLFESHINYLFEDREASVNYIIDLIAFKIQNPMIKPRVFVLIVSPDTYQIGKSAIKDVCEICMGEWNIGSASQSDFSKSGVVYNEFMVEKLAFFVDEIYGIGSGGAKEVKELVKTWATEKRISYNIKYGGKGKTTNYAIPFFFSNHLDAIKIDTHDARAFVEITTSRRKPQEYYDKLWDWMNSVQGKSAIMYYFMNRDVSKFNPMDIPINSEAKQEIAEQNMSPMALFIRKSIMNYDPSHKEFKNLPDAMYLSHIKSLLLRLDEFRNDRDDLDKKEFGFALKEAGVVQVKMVVRSKVVDGNDGIMRLGVIRNIDTWNDKLSECLKATQSDRGRAKWRGLLRNEADKAFELPVVVGKLVHAKLLKAGKVGIKKSTWTPKIIG